MAKTRIPQKLQPWVEARKRYHLSHLHVQMARELGMNPKKLGRIANHHQESWKLPLPEYIEKLYAKHFGRSQPEKVLSIEALVKEQERRKRQRKADKQQLKNGERPPSSAAVPANQDTGKNA